MADMALDFSIQPPQWLTRQSEWAKGTGERGFESFMRGAQFFTNQKKEQLNLASQALGIEAQQQALDLNAVLLKAKAEDTATIPAWLREHPTFESRQTAEWPTAKTHEGMQMLEQARLRDTTSLQHTVAVQDLSSFAKQIAALDAEDRAAIRSMQPNRDGTPSAMQWQALGLAEQSQKLHRENESEAAAMDAALRGDSVTTKVTDKGTTTTIKSTSSSATTMPKEATLSDGSKIVVNPKTGAFKFMAKDGKEKEFTKPQLLAIAKHLKDVDPEDVNAKKIDDFLASGAVEQITPKTNPPSAAPASTTKSGLRYEILPVK